MARFFYLIRESDGKKSKESCFNAPLYTRIKMNKPSRVRYSTKKI